MRGENTTHENTRNDRDMHPTNNIQCGRTGNLSFVQSRTSREVKDMYLASAQKSARVI